MKITKYTHSCLLIETEERSTIIDPGKFSWDAGLLDISKMARVDDIIITHEHPDHFYMPFVEALKARFPEAVITTTPLVAEKLLKRGISSVKTTSTEGLEVVQATHESMEPLAPPPNMSLIVHYLDRLTHPGDNHHFKASKEILALPVNAPWGTWCRAAELGVELKPKIIIPIHDWHLNSLARVILYDRLEAFFKERDINFLKVTDGEPVKI